MALLEIEAVAKAFGSLRAVDGVTLGIESGRIQGIAGPNGSGKSTLFNLVTGIPYGPDRGAIRLEGEAIERMPAHEIARRGVARTFQRETGFDGLTVFENALVGATFGGRLKASVAARTQAAAALELAGLPPAGFGRLARELSVFDRKCLMLATACAMRPKLLLLDEPASGLTRPEIEATIGLIRAIAATGVTVVLIEHVLTFLMKLSDHLVVLNGGRVLASGEPRAVTADPAVVEAYLGTRKAAAA